MKVMKACNTEEISIGTKTQINNLTHLKNKFYASIALDGETVRRIQTELTNPFKVCEKKQPQIRPKMKHLGEA